jgi:hypothetical protein
MFVENFNQKVPVKVVIDIKVISKIESNMLVYLAY